MLSHDTHLTLKVEGIVRHGKRPGLYRSVHAVKVTVTSNLQARSQMTQESKVRLLLYLVVNKVCLTLLVIFQLALGSKQRDGAIQRTGPIYMDHLSSACQ